jgi:hypothetical protein
VISLDDVVQISHLPALRLLQQFAFLHKVGHRRAIGGRFNGCDLQWLFPTVEGLAQEALGGLNVPRRRQVKVDGVAVLGNGSIE